MIWGTQMLKPYLTRSYVEDESEASTSLSAEARAVVDLRRSRGATLPRPNPTPLDDCPPDRSGDSLYRVKPAFVASLDGLSRRLVAADVSADAVTLAALPLQLAAAAAIVVGVFWPLTWLLVGPALLVLMGVNALDGVVARRTGTSTHGGAIRNELVDRAGDMILLLAGFAVAPWPIVVAALLAVSATEAAALIGWSVTGQRSFPGPMGKPDRAAAVAVGAVVALVWSPGLPIAYLVIAIGAAIGTVSRVRSGFALARHLDRGAFRVG